MYRGRRTQQGQGHEGQLGLAGLKNISRGWGGLKRAL